MTPATDPALSEPQRDGITVQFDGMTYYGACEWFERLVREIDTAPGTREWTLIQRRAFVKKIKAALKGE